MIWYSGGTMKRQVLFFVLGVSLVPPFAAFAATGAMSADLPASAVGQGVVINEVAWMGDADSWRNQWIELANRSSTSVDLSGWTLSFAKTTITLGKSIPGGGYYVIARKVKHSQSSVQADLIASFGRGLVHKGMTLVLRDSSGSVVDTVEGGDHWANIGGDNTSKDTAQRQPDDTWITAHPTPGAANSVRSSNRKKILGARGSEAVSNATDTAGAAGAKDAADTSDLPQPAPAHTHRHTHTARHAHAYGSSGSSAESYANSASAATAAIPQASGSMLSAPAAPAISSFLLWIGLAVSLSIAGIFGTVLIFEQRKKTPADEYQIIETDVVNK